MTYSQAVERMNQHAKIFPVMTKEKEQPMKYSDLMAVMAEFHAGNVSRNIMVAAIALWQRPVECARPFGADMTRAAVEAVIR